MHTMTWIFRWRFRLLRATVMGTIDVIQSGHDGRNQDLIPTLKALLRLGFTQQAVSRRDQSGNLHGVSTPITPWPSPCEREIIFFNWTRLKRRFFCIDHFPHVIGSIDSITKLTDAQPPPPTHTHHHHHHHHRAHAHATHIVTPI